MIPMSAPARPPISFCTETPVYDTPADPLIRLFSTVVPSFRLVVSNECHNSVDFDHMKLMTSVLSYHFSVAVITTLTPGNPCIKMGKYQYHLIELAKGTRHESTVIVQAHYIE